MNIFKRIERGYQTDLIVWQNVSQTPIVPIIVYNEGLQIKKKKLCDGLATYLKSFFKKKIEF